MNHVIYWFQYLPFDNFKISSVNFVTFMELCEMAQ